MTETGITKSSGNIFVDLGFEKDYAAVMLVRVEVAVRIAVEVKEKGWAIAEVAHHLGVTQHQASQLINTKVDDLSLDTLWTLATRLGLRLELAAPKK